MFPVLNLAPLRLLLLVALMCAPLATASATDVEPAEYLPSGATIRQTVRGDVDGDGRDDTVVLYSVQATAAAAARANLLVLRTTDDGVRPVHLFGTPPDLRGEPTLDPNGSAELTLGDLNADGVSEIQLAVTVRYQEPRPRTMLWGFGHGDVPPPADGDAPVRPPWDGTGFRLEAYLEGNTVTIAAPARLNPDRTSTLRREMQERRFGGPDPTLDVSETFTWRDGAFRLTRRSLALPAETGASARSPETAVLAFYEAQGRGDLEAAADLLGDELRASRVSNLLGDPSTPLRQVQVEELRTLDDPQTRRARTEADRLVFVRVSQFDPLAAPPPPPAETDWIDTIPPPLPPRSTLAGTWRTRKVGDRWRLVAATLDQAANLDAISATLPPGASVVQTANADLRGRGVTDLAVIASGPGRLPLLEPYVILAGPAGLERSVRLGSFVAGDFYGAVGGTIRADDVNGDGTPEITFSAFVGAHSALLWVLQWDGSTFVPLFDEASNAPAIDLADLDGDGVAEIVLGQSGYCGSYAASPRATFVFRWQDGAYRSASARYPDLQEGIDEHAAEVAAGGQDPGRDDAARACVQHMLALANAFRGRAAETRAAYGAYARLRQTATAPTGLSARPIYLGASYVEADLRAVLAAAERGESPGWGAAERAILHDMLGDALVERARGYQYLGESADRAGKPDESREARRKASEARQAATREYQAALDLDPTDEEARRALGE